ncbi:hypothetical protein [Gracilimonas sp.]|uniref:hypothetical protein n=1 Tax=Gracilimonas sp. TaxID=1974203 RepID=UPI0028721C71|nr:hypothetical protein [Gracilimonas sp.]
MKRKNDIEQELDQKEFESELDRDLSTQYRKLDAWEKLHEDKNPYVIAAMNFFASLVFFEAFYFVIKLNINYITLGYTMEFFEVMDPFLHVTFFVISVMAIINKRSAVDVIIERWPF